MVAPKPIPVAYKTAVPEETLLMKRRSFLKGAGLGAAAGIASPAIARTSRRSPGARLRAIEVAGDPVRSPVPISRSGRCGHRRQVPDPGLRRRRDRSRRCRRSMPSATAPSRCATPASYYYVGKDPTFALRHSCALRPEYAASRTPGSTMAAAWMLLNEFFTEAQCLRASRRQHRLRRWAAGSARRSRRVADLQGLKMRIGGLAGSVAGQARRRCRSRSAAATSTRRSSSGTIDARRVQVGPYDDEKLGFTKVAPYYYYPWLLGRLGRSSTSSSTLAEVGQPCRRDLSEGAGLRDRSRPRQCRHAGEIRRAEPGRAPAFWLPAAPSCGSCPTTSSRRRLQDHSRISTP